jgi:mannose-6-phosphate isomerase-like protein (cupin superfamily)
MQVKRIADAQPYEAAKHHAMCGLRLQGHDATDTDAFWVGLSHFLPSGGAEMSASTVERVYVVISGELTITTEGGEITLRALDSCHLAPLEPRKIENRTNCPASILVIMPYSARSGAS